MRVGKQAHASGLQVSVCVGGSADREAFNLIEAALLADALVIAALSNSLLANAPWAVSNTRRFELVENRSLARWILFHFRLRRLKSQVQEYNLSSHQGGHKPRSAFPHGLPLCSWSRPDAASADPSLSAGEKDEAQTGLQVIRTGSH